MKKYIVEKHTTEITSYKAARAAFEGMTLDEELNRRDTSADEIHTFDTEEEARAFLNKQTNDYFYNGSGCGMATEWWMEEADVDEDGDWCDDGSGYYDCPNSNFAEFKARFE